MGEEWGGFHDDGDSQIQIQQKKKEQNRRDKVMSRGSCVKQNKNNIKNFFCQQCPG